MHKNTLHNCLNVKKLMFSYYIFMTDDMSHLKNKKIKTKFKNGDFANNLV